MKTDEEKKAAAAYMREWSKKQRELNPEKWREQHNHSMRKWKAANPEKAKALARKYYEKTKDANKEKLKETQKQSRIKVQKKRPNRQRIWSITQRCKKRGLEMNITEQYLDDLMKNTPVCPILGIPLDYSNTSGQWFDSSSVHLDRIDNAKGYIEGNVHFISGRANMIKRDATIEELEKLLSYLRKLI